MCELPQSWGYPIKDLAETQVLKDWIMELNGQQGQDTGMQTQLWSN